MLEGDALTIARALDEHSRNVYVLLELNNEDFAVARALMLHDPELGLRGPDALHLAVTQRHGETLYTLDTKLLACAAALGIPATHGGILPAEPH